MNTSIYFLVRSWNCFPYLMRCLTTIHRQKNQDFTVLFIDDASEYTQKQKTKIRHMLRGHIVQFNTQRKYAARNAYETIHRYVANDDAIIINVDGDDWLSKRSVIESVVRAYKNTHCLLTYGNCRYYDPGNERHNKIVSSFSLANHRYTQDVERKHAYRKTFFLPMHLRTWNAGLFKKIKKESFLRPDGSWQRTCEDEATMLPLLEMAHGRYEVMKEVLYVYNVHRVHNEAKAIPRDCFYDELVILKKTPYRPLL